MRSRRMASSSVLEPMVLLYRRTGDPRYLEFAQYLVVAWAGPDGPNLLNKALTETNAAKRKAMYQRANRMIMNFLPGVPYAHTKPALGFQTNVVGYKPSPVTLESFAPVRFIG